MTKKKPTTTKSATKAAKQTKRELLCLEWPDERGDLDAFADKIADKVIAEIAADGMADRIADKVIAEIAADRRRRELQQQNALGPTASKPHHQHLEDKLGKAIQASMLQALTPEKLDEVFALLDLGVSHAPAFEDADEQRWFNIIRDRIALSPEAEEMGRTAPARTETFASRGSRVCADRVKRYELCLAVWELYNRLMSANR
jgi:hypothetical protein